MAYNYRKEYLHANKELLEKLIRLADDQASAEANFDDPGEAEMFQYRVNNLLRSLAIHYPTRSYVRNALGTTVSLRDGKWLVTIGPILAGRRGRKPARMVELAPRQEDGLLTITEAITADNWLLIATKLAAAKLSQDTRRVTILIPPDEKGIQFIADKLAPEFQLVTTSPSMVLERVAASHPPVQP